MMASVLLIGVTIFMAAYGAFKRHAPVYGVKQERLDRIDGHSYALLDVRAYNRSDKEPISEAFNLPISYFSRGYGEIPQKPIHVIAENQVEKNLAARLLQRKGFNVASYSVMGKNSEDKMTSACF